MKKYLGARYPIWYVVKVMLLKILCTDEGTPETLLSPGRRADSENVKIQPTVPPQLLEY